MPYKDAEAAQANKRKYYLKNRKRFLVARRKYRAENREKVLECQRDHYCKNAPAVKEYQKQYYAENNSYVDARNRKYQQIHKEEISQWQRGYRVENYRKLLLYRLKCRAENQGVPFNLSLDDLQIPIYCPVFGKRLRIGKSRGFRDWSPSADKVIPRLGYVKGNVQIISNRANLIKRDASLKELESIVDYVRRVTPAG
jgi:hypothetical protein